MTARSEEAVRQVRCPAPGCGAVFEVEARRLGRHVDCPRCGGRLTARPLGVERRLVEQELRIAGSVGAELSRLPLAVVLDNVRSLWNVGSMFRTADACGVRELVLCGITGCPPREQIAKTALGAERAVAWRYHADPLEALAGLRRAGFTPVALENAPAAVALERVAWPERVCLVVGNEVTGITPAVLDTCALRVRIEMRGVKDSLNVAVAFGIAVHAAARALETRAAEGGVP